MALGPCASCGELVAVGACVCPLCGDKACSTRSVRGAAVLLGLTLAAGCGGKDEQDTAGTPTGTMQPEYGASATTRIVDPNAPTAEMVQVLQPAKR